MSVWITPAHAAMNMTGDGEEAASYCTDADGSVVVLARNTREIPQESFPTYTVLHSIGEEEVPTKQCR